MITIMKKKHWKSTPGCVYNINYHIVYSTKYRKKVLTGEIGEALKKINEEIALNNDIGLIEQEVMPDHVHLFVSAHPKYSPSKIVKIFKGGSARKLFTKFPELRNQLWRGHLWNPSYYVGTVGDITKEVVEKYIAMQKVKNSGDTEDN